ncbi:MAG: 2-C-methyl-D-erythritol 2,4-cyclodiphosphate synthase, partial [Candidatus Dormibacteraceae bacterium]
GWEVANVDSVITAQAPRLQPHLAAMSNRLAGQLALAPTQVSVKASSPEGVGALGRAESIAAMAVALVSSLE